MGSPTDTDSTIETYAAALVEAVTSDLGPWMRRAIVSRHPDPLPVAAEVRVSQGVEQIGPEIGRRLAELLANDIDDQWTNPLSILRAAAGYPTAILTELGIAPVERDSTDQRIQPEDVYALAPAAFADISPAVHDAGLMWGAAKAHLHLQRRKQREVPPDHATESDERRA